MRKQLERMRESGSKKERKENGVRRKKRGERREPPREQTGKEKRVKWRKENGEDV